MFTRDMRELHPKIQGPAAEWLRRCSMKGYTVLVTETRRDNGTQRAYYARGRRPLAEVATLYRAAGLVPPTAAENQSTITNAETAIDSWHFYGCALDFVPLIAGTRTVLDWDYTPNDPADHWDEIEQLAEELGFLWGGDWTSRKDRPHIELHTGWTIDQARAWARANPGAWRLPL